MDINTTCKNQNLGLVSIITPAYRAESIVNETIDSVINQTYANWELLIADDCSPDRTAEVVATAASMDSRVKLIRCEINGGPAAARNAAIRRAKGKWIAFLDSDDLWTPTKLEDTIAYSLSKNSALTYTGFRRFSGDGSRLGAYINIPEELDYEKLLGNTAIATSTVLINRDLVGNFEMKNCYYDDFACWLSILKSGYSAYGLNQDLMRYRIMKNSVSRNKFKSASEVWKTYRNIERLGVFKSASCFVRYAINAYIKYKIY